MKYVSGADVGKPSDNPVQFIEFYVNQYGYLNRIRSSRALERDVYVCPCGELLEKKKPAGRMECCE